MKTVEEYLNSLEWDGEERLATWLQQAFEASDDKRYLNDVGSKVLIGAVARVMQPGCKVDNMLVLQGVQGAGKSRALSILFGEWLAELYPSMINEKDCALGLQGKWAVEIPEIDSFDDTEASKLKHFLRTQVDRFRPPYSKSYEDHPRQMIFVGTVNSDDWLGYCASNRMFSLVSCERVNFDWLRENRDQLWAEAVCLYRDDFPWWVANKRMA